MSLVRSLRDNLKSLGFVEEIEMIETEDDSKQKRPSPKKRTIDVLESTVSLYLKKRILQIYHLKPSEQQKRGRSSGHTTSGTSDFYSAVGSESESSYQTAGENDDFKPKFLKKLNDTLATGLVLFQPTIFILFYFCFFQKVISLH